MVAFVLGAIGAAAPEILRLYRARLVPQSMLPEHYWVASALYVGLGGVVALVLAAPGNLASAFYVGLSLPVVISTAQRSIAESSPGASDVEEIDVRDGLKFREKLVNYARIL